MRSDDDGNALLTVAEDEAFEDRSVEGRRSGGLGTMRGKKVLVLT